MNKIHSLTSNTSYQLPSQNHKNYSWNGRVGFDLTWTRLKKAVIDYNRDYFKFPGKYYDYVSVFTVRNLLPFWLIILDSWLRLGIDYD